MVKSLRDRIIDSILNAKKVNRKEIEELVKSQEDSGTKFETALVQKGLISEEEFLAIMSRETNSPAVCLERFEIDKDLMTLIPERICKQYNVFPMVKMSNLITIAMSDPLNIFALDDLKSMTGFEINLVIATEKDITSAIGQVYQELKDENVDEIVGQMKEEDLNVITGIKDLEAGVEMDKTLLESEESPIVKLVNLMLVESMRRRASDIHIEPEYDRLRIRYRIDGILHDVYNIPKQKQSAVIARIKIMSRLDITEFRVPQDGRFKIKVAEKEIDFRVSVLPISFGEKVVLRLLDKANLSIGLDKLGFLDEPVKLFKESVAKPYGMILVTGPTGSGKSTTLYSIINQMNTPERHIITVEDPVEYQIEGIAQVQVKPEIGLSFASGLRSLLRQSPDIILIGEIRDSETADIAVKASLTGQLVLSTLHTNDAPGAITRLIDMGVEPFLVSSSLIMACAQRLTRKICSYCKEEFKPDEKVIKDLNLTIEKDTKFYHGKGCKICNNTGYYGRIGTLEVMMMDDEIRDMIIKRLSSDKIKIYAVNKGMEDLRANGLRQAKIGLTTLEEILRITSEE